MDIDVADVLEKAADHIRNGWTQGRAFEAVDGKVHCCAEGALGLATGAQVALDGASSYWTKFMQADLWADAMEALENYVGDDVDAWNDAIGQTQDRVADTMLRLAKELRNNGST